MMKQAAISFVLVVSFLACSDDDDADRDDGTCVNCVCVNCVNDGDTDDVDNGDSGSDSDTGPDLLDAAPPYRLTSLQTISAAFTPVSVVVADVNKDTHVDLVVAEGAGWQLAKGAANGVFGALSTPAGSAQAVSAVAVADFNNDTYPDVIASRAGTGVAEIYLNTHDAVTPFNTTILVGLDGVATSLLLLDVDGDGDSDVLASTLNNVVVIRINDGTGSLTTPPGSYPAGVKPTGLRAGHLNGDGFIDLLVVNPATQTATILMGTGAGVSAAFAPPVILALDYQPTSAAIADFNGDTKNDIAIGYYGEAHVSVLPGSGTGTFGAAVETESLGGVTAIASADLNGDGRVDLVLGGVANLYPAYFMGRGNGAFLVAPKGEPSQPIALYGDQSDLVLADVNHDNQLDHVSVFVSGSSPTVAIRTATSP